MVTRRNFVKTGLLFLPAIAKAAAPFTFSDIAWMRRLATPASGVSDVTDGLVGWWKLDDGSGTSAADSAGSNNGTLVNTPTWTTGKNGGALLLNGSNQTIEFGAHSEFNPAQPTVCLWCQSTNAPAQYEILIENTNGGAQNHGWGLYFNSSTQVVFHFNSYTNVASATVSDPTEWHHIAATYDEQNIRIYVDGVEGTPKSTTTAIDYSDCTMIAGYVNTALYYDGKLDDIRIYNRALSSTEIGTIYTATGG